MHHWISGPDLALGSGVRVNIQEERGKKIPGRPQIWTQPQVNSSIFVKVYRQKTRIRFLNKIDNNNDIVNE